MSNPSEIPAVKNEVKQEFGTVWIEDANGVSRKVRVLQVTPTKPLAAGGGGARAAGGSGVVRAIVNTASAGAAASTSSGGPRVLQPTFVPRPSGSGLGQAQVVRAAGVSSAARAPAVRVVQRTIQVQPAAAGAAPSATVVKMETPSTSSTAVNSPIARLQMQDRQMAGLGTPGRPGSQQQLAIHRTPTTGGGRLLLPAGGSPATPAARPTPGTSAGKRSAQSPHLSWSDSKRRRYDRNAKGLRHFSMKVCQKVREKGITTYNEVADELVAELCPPAGAIIGTSPDQQYEQKNIRRRVYDALNVLMAMQIISKERKQIKWLGLAPMTAPVEEPPDNSEEEAACRQRIKEKTQQLKDLVLRQIAFKNLVERNRRLEQTHGAPEPSSSVQLPFIVVNTDKKTVIDCSMSNDK
ncbi:Transcription factor Dp-1 [Amphibalanus amphitrite]|uniref:Transcription factor Dp-1 n=2 Tax=Amphibalanus amphitrite TaxID=1232801 RepID=A0A6A4VR67_AMPAM|nr:Transcription factor Dp-1 [Amphibalanus amphitrite]KAF0293202.1 Transcription factor Dp-1 [Amphibalanus amphitrite]